MGELTPDLFEESALARQLGAGASELLARLGDHARRVLLREGLTQRIELVARGREIALEVATAHRRR